MQIDHLVHSLVNDLMPVKPLAPTVIRLVRWLAVGVGYMAIVVFAMGIRADIADKFQDADFISQEFLMLVTGIAAGWAALSVGVPGSARWIRYVPSVPLLLWIGSMAYQCIEEWTASDFIGAAFSLDLKCIPGIAITGLLPIIVMTAMIRSGDTQFRGVAVFWGTLGSAALANAALRLFHPVDAATMVVVWQFGTVIAFTSMATIIRKILVPIPKVIASEQ